MGGRDFVETLEDVVRLTLGAAALVGAGWGGLRGWRDVTLALVGNGLLVSGAAGLMEAGLVPGGVVLAKRMTDGAVLLIIAAGICAMVGWARGRRRVRRAGTP